MAKLATESEMLSALTLMIDQAIAFADAGQQSLVAAKLSECRDAVELLIEENTRRAKQEQGD